MIVGPLYFGHARKGRRPRRPDHDRICVLAAVPVIRFPNGNPDFFRPTLRDRVYTLCNRRVVDALASVDLRELFRAPEEPPIPRLVPYDSPLCDKCGRQVEDDALFELGMVVAELGHHGADAGPWAGKAFDDKGALDLYVIDQLRRPLRAGAWRIAGLEKWT